MDVFLNEILNLNVGSKDLTFEYEKNTLVDDFKVVNEFKYTNSGAYLSGTELEKFNDLVFKVKKTDSNWKDFFNLESNKNSYISFENSLTDFSKLWQIEESTRTINDYLKGIYSFGQFRLNDLKIRYKKMSPISLGQIIIPYTYKTSYTTISSNDIVNTSGKAKEYLNALLNEFRNQTAIKATDSQVLRNTLAFTASVKTPLWLSLDLNFGGGYYNSFNYKDYNEELKKLLVYNENNILKVNGNNSSFVYKIKIESALYVSDNTTEKTVEVNLGYFKYKFSHKGAIFSADAS
ncbi:hypothetical protein [Spiroplasma floricola]|uniref:Uncharacterized protein n=1 Tax=Spiroplasma floricola 23-6 TaxID=1336749 RepID=A0A2K8SEK1_9MOLU|nr:hypothetical protein [Spiroplasma floricola]AUB31785.1 hypothetical protein SFLOR_v1c07370 [Spiroplasma floricola 23-6]